MFCNNRILTVITEIWTVCNYDYTFRGSSDGRTGERSLFVETCLLDPQLKIVWKKLLSDELWMKDWSPFKKGEIGENVRLLNQGWSRVLYSLVEKTWHSKWPKIIWKHPTICIPAVPVIFGNISMVISASGDFIRLVIWTVILRHTNINRPYSCNRPFQFDRTNLFRRSISSKLLKE